MVLSSPDRRKTSKQRINAFLQNLPRCSRKNKGPDIVHDDLDGNEHDGSSVWGRVQGLLVEISQYSDQKDFNSYYPHLSPFPSPNHKECHYKHVSQYLSSPPVPPKEYPLNDTSNTESSQGSEWERLGAPIGDSSYFRLSPLKLPKLTLSPDISVININSSASLPSDEYEHSTGVSSHSVSPAVSSTVVVTPASSLDPGVSNKGDFKLLLKSSKTSILAPSTHSSVRPLPKAPSSDKSSISSSSSRLKDGHPLPVPPSPVRIKNRRELPDVSAPPSSSEMSDNSLKSKTDSSSLLSSRNSESSLATSASCSAQNVPYSSIQSLAPPSYIPRAKSRRWKLKQARLERTDTLVIRELLKKRAAGRIKISSKGSIRVSEPKSSALSCRLSTVSHIEREGSIYSESSKYSDDSEELDNGLARITLKEKEDIAPSVVVRNETVPNSDAPDCVDIPGKEDIGVSEVTEKVLIPTSIVEILPLRIKHKRARSSLDYVIPHADDRYSSIDKVRYLQYAMKNSYPRP